MAFKLDKKKRVQEILKCGKDPVYFLKTYARISHPLHGLILFNTYPFQDVLLKDFNDYRFNVILKARQLGISTITAGYIVWLMLFHRDKAVLVMATKFATAGNLVNKVKKIMRGDVKPEDMEQKKLEVASEIGDVLWYCAALAQDIGISLSVIATQNLDKLENRKQRDAIHGDGDNR